MYLYHSLKLWQCFKTIPTLYALFAAIFLVSCSSLSVSQPPKTIEVSPTKDVSESASILEKSKQALLTANTLRMKSVWVFPTSTTEEKIMFVSPDRYRATQTKVCSDGVEWELVQIGQTSYTRCPPNPWQSHQMQIDPPHVRIVNTYWNIATPIGSVSRKGIGTETFLSIDAEFSRPYNGRMETGTISFLIQVQTLLPYKLEITKVYQDQKSSGTIEFSDFNSPMTITEPLQ